MTHFELTFGGYLLPRLECWEASTAASELAALALHNAPLWLHIDPFYNAGKVADLGALLEAASARRIGIVPTLGDFVPEAQQPAVAVRQPGGAQDAGICYHHPDTLRLAVERANGFIGAFGGLICLHLFTGQPVLHFAPELTPPVESACYCAHCAAGFAAHLEEHGFAPVSSPPQHAQEGYLWCQWLDYQADAVPRFALRLIQVTRNTIPFWVAR